MATKHTGTIIVKGTSGNMGKVILPGCDSLTKVSAFFTAADSLFELGAISFAHSEVTCDGTSDTIASGNSDRKAIISYKDKGTNTIKRMSLPGYTESDTYRVFESGGERVTQAALTLFESAFEAATDKQIVAIDGYVIQKR